MKKLKSPISVHYEVTEACNNKCKHCYNSFRFNFKKKSSKINSETSMKVADAIIQAEIFHVILTGGEPLLDKQTLFTIAERLTGNNIRLSLNTNLTTLCKDDARRIKEIGFKNVLTSVIHYNKSIHDTQTQNIGSLEKTIKSIELLLDADIHIGANMVVTNNTIEDVYKTGSFLAKIGIKSFAATRVAPNYSETKQLNNLISPQGIISIFDQLLQLENDYNISVASLNATPLCFKGAKEKYQQLLQRGCAAGSASATIDYLGNLRACQHSCNSAGNIIDENVFDVWQRIPIWKKQYLPEICEPCPEKNSCGGGCRETARSVYDDLKSADPFARGPEYVLRKPKPNKVPNNQRLRFTKDILTRNEESGGVLFKSPNAFTILSKQGYDVAKRLSNTLFSIQNLYDMSEQPIDKISRFINRLYSQNIVMEV